jgi:hypothetical protein
MAVRKKYFVRFGLTVQLIKRLFPCNIDTKAYGFTTVSRKKKIAHAGLEIRAMKEEAALN